MWTSTALLALLALLAAATATPLPDQGSRYFQASEEHLQRQLQVLRLFLNERHLELYEPFTNIASSYRLEDDVDSYTKPEVVREFLSYSYEPGYLFPKTKIFTLYEEFPRNEAEICSLILATAKDFDTFIKAAVFLKKALNPGVFHYGLRAALGLREDTKFFYYPPVYETYPYLFFDERVINKALDTAIAEWRRGGDFKPVFIRSNYSGYWDARRSPDAVLEYFTGAASLSMFHVETARTFLPFFNTSLLGQRLDREGELFLNYHRQMLARYYLERLSNGLGDLPYLDFDEDLSGFFPRLRHMSGQAVTPRQPYTNIRSTKKISLDEYRVYYRRTRDAISSGHALARNGTYVSLRGKGGLDILAGTLLTRGEANINYEYYDSVFQLFQYLLGAGDTTVQPTSLLLLETTLRDPLYYRGVYTFLTDYIYQFLKTLPKYTYDETAHPELTVESVDVDKLITYFEDFNIDLFHAVGTRLDSARSQPSVFATTSRLNHRPFSYRVSIDSAKDADVIVKVYVTPKHDAQGRPISLNKKIFYAFEIDRFPAKVTAGKNLIQRKSEDSAVAVGDPATFKQMWQKIHDAIEGKVTFNVDKFARPYGFPQHLLLPKGTRAGLPVHFVVAVFPYEQADTTDAAVYDVQSFPLLGAPRGVRFPDPRPVSFPTDRLYRSEYDAAVPNVFTKEVRIFHKSLEEATGETV